MKLNWKFPSQEITDEFRRACIEFEYQLRPKITKFLLERMDAECSGDLTSFHFDVDVDSQWVWIGLDTPEHYIEKIKSDFDHEINGDLNFSVLVS